MDGSRDWTALGREVIDIEIDGLRRVRDRLGESFARAVEMLGDCPGRVVVTGIGKSGLVGRKIAATFSSTGTPATFLHPVEGAHGDLGMVRPGDVVLAISNSGETDELNAILPALRSLGANLVAMTGGNGSTLASMADLVLDCGVEREACPLGLAPTASTSAQLAVGDALAVCLIERGQFGEADFQRCHPGGALGRRLACRVEEIMQRENLPVVAPGTPVTRALEVMTSGGLGFVAVAEDGRLRGVLSDGDVRRLASSGLLDPARPVDDAMTADPKVLRVGQSAAQAMDLMESRQITVLPVLDGDGGLAGMVHLHDLLGKGRFKFAG
ncbi:KpsF/GutQ family sugar-phosphate isomerase [Desulfohalovibrio reitneri]|uniref:KpsF/GutQ family sugar-phosphate isomerase n=1 Tax=Desulfohalovibrio reitneri TaxID=1307759 RepID=UPI0005504837|nr:KpsF/GutQ family sugar-phosphate isomerase [Desulfohalovibrio reitneri]